MNGPVHLYVGDIIMTNYAATLSIAALLMEKLAFASTVKTSYVGLRTNIIIMLYKLNMNSMCAPAHIHSFFDSMRGYLAKSTNSMRHLKCFYAQSIDCSGANVD